MNRINIIASGEVQRVGYRDFVTKIAKKNNITGIVRNCPGYDVEIIAEGNEQDLEQFVSQIKIQKDPIFVESIKIEPGTYEGKWKYFEIQRGSPDEELGERLDAAIVYLVRIDSNSRRSVEIGELMLEKQDQMLDKQDQMLDKQDQMLDKQDQMLDKQDQMLDKQDQMLDKQDYQISLQKGTIQEIQEMRSDLKDSLQVRYQNIEQQLHEIQTILKNAGMMS
ncbi:MAG TPA: acylphosphatase [Methanospirillum sp.]|jgi:acylphosphatase|uniref:acylphosphatase n=1 Tax=Methanospirillum sp. TaxID=45200 RepID=UPI0009CDC513|nr:acylphosphatase [Methanospirillum sp.]NLL09452.1 acylphosphatase [Methanomicrobiales archaeon]OQB57361.1 MAG: Acylphosphatase [Bacteroidetes bacterium ADurb.Bin145]HPY61017.1 acylphosphatase [Methanospirillum sp.]